MEPIRLHHLADNEGARKTRKRIGRGIGSGKGKTGGRGVKGQKSRSGVAIKGFEGGQMPIHMRVPKRGFNPYRQSRFAWINLDQLDKALQDGRLDSKAELGEDDLVNAGLVRRKRDGIRLLGRGKLSAAIKLSVSGASKNAAAAVEKAGGKLTLMKDAGSEKA